MLSDDERERYEGWVRAVGPRALAYARSLVRDPSRAEDVVQECLFRLLRRAARYDLERDGVKLLFTAISNLCINQASRAREVQCLDTSSDSDSDPAPIPDRAALLPVQVLQHRELEEAVRRALGQLPPLQRAAVELRSLGMSKDEIATVLGVTATYAGVLVHRGRQLLAVVLAPYVDAEIREPV